MKIKIKLYPEYYSVLEEGDKILFYIRDFLKVLEDDQYFEKKILELRKSLLTKQPQTHLGEKIEYIELVQKHFGLDANLLVLSGKKTILEEIDNLCQKYSLPPLYWIIPFYSLIKFDFLLLPLMPADITITDDKALHKEIVDNSTSWLHPSDTVYVGINKKFTKTQLLRTVEKRWSEIEIKLKDLDEIIPKRKRIKRRNLELYKKIFELRKENKKFTEIAEIINKETRKALSDSEVKVMHGRYIKTIKSLRK